MAPSRAYDSGNRAQRKSTKQVNAKHQALKNQPDAVLAKEPRSGADVPVELQQRVLDCFTGAFRDVFEPIEDERPLKALLQEVKGHLYDRDFSKAFGREDYLQVYAARWSASRALGYMELFVETLQIFEAGHIPPTKSQERAMDLQTSASEGDQVQTSSPRAIKVVALGGGGGAELCAFAAAMRFLGTNDRLCISLVDSADWRVVVQKLEQALIKPASVSPYASATVKAVASMPVIDPVELDATFHHLNLLEPGKEQDMLNQLTSGADIITLAFTLNELYSKSLPQAQNFLLVLTEAMKPGALLLVVDSPGSYSTVTINGREKKYPMQWLLQHTLLNVAPSALQENSPGDASEASDPKRRPNGEAPVLWQLVDSTQSRWYRLPQGLKYPLELENMRFQMSLWRRL